MRKESRQRGAALVIALLVVLVLSLLVIGLIATTTTETNISSNQVRDTQALTVAEAGVEEVINRMLVDPSEDQYIGDPDDPLNPDWCTVVTLEEPSGGGDTTWVATVQQGTYKLKYATKDENGPPEDFLSVRHKTGGTNGDSIYFDSEQVLEAPDYDGNPVEVIEVTGTKGNAKRRLIIEVVRAPVHVTIQAALRVHSGVDTRGTMDVCGHDHTLDFWDDFPLEPPACSTYHAEPCIRPFEPEEDGQDEDYWDDVHVDCDDAGCMEAVECWGSFDRSGGPSLWGNPALDTTPETPFLELYEILGFESQDDMMASIDWDTVVTGHDVAGFCVAVEGQFRPGPGSGHGVLWVTGDPGDMMMPSNYRFKGLIYVDGNARFHGTCSILGTVVVKAGYEDWTGGAGTAQIYLSTEAVKEEIERGIGRFQRLTWREKP